MSIILFIPFFCFGWVSIGFILAKLVFEPLDDGIRIPNKEFRFRVFGWPIMLGVILFYLIARAAIWAIYKFKLDF